MLLQGLLTCVWYDQSATLQRLEQRQATQHFVAEILSKTSCLKQDFEVKRFMLGLSSLLIPVAMPEVITKNYSSIMKALTYLSSKSVEIRTKEDTKEEMAEEDNDN
jgi:hypothetical protein